MFHSNEMTYNIHWIDGNYYIPWLFKDDTNWCFNKIILKIMKPNTMAHLIYAAFYDYFKIIYIIRMASSKNSLKYSENVL